MGWATVQDCQSLTGYTPTSGDLVVAQTVVETFVNRTEDAAASFTVRDVDTLRKAVCFQAAWLAGQPGYLTRMGATSLQQDGLSTTLTNPADMTLAPLAQRAIKNLSWMGTRTIQRRRYDRALTGLTAETWLTTDPQDGWEPM
jgi:hypothetical protein